MSGFWIHNTLHGHHSTPAEIVDLRRLGQTTQVSRSTLAQVRERIRQLRESTANKVTAKNFDFQKRLQDVRDVETAERDKRREERKRKRAERREDDELAKIGIIKRSRPEELAELVSGGGKRRGKENVIEEKRRREAKEKEDREVERAQKEHEDIAASMGFAGFGGGRKR